ncbi:hypothetical protein A1O1_05715 [Capronia coronata CBS 617.96]|uniref:RING-type E3 ubiquitin transferase n=1 Tax=Capronia coronata CBS 617.96 TaxID=1182541 RepID=W9Y809_9EURO|nr:uncharacterized protein A1O1_05715 [Capronia coronata CBS 617.96]EXJ85351.1 hypothetical protein A1O1_05715 [Capronia coronata CBS 617.96]
MPPNLFRPTPPLGYPEDDFGGLGGPMTPGSLQDLFSLILQSVQPAAALRPDADGTRAAGQQPHPFDLLSQLFNPGNAQHGDVVFTQEAFDRVMTQLMDENQAGNAPPPASEDAIKSLKKKRVDHDMLGSDGMAECSICMDNVELGDEMTVLPCNHWFHGDCVTAWLKEHDTCPHCRRPISNANVRNEQTSPRRRMSRHLSPVISSPQGFGPEGSRQNPVTIPESPTESQQSRQSYYGRRRESDLQPSTSVRQPRSPQETRRHSSRGNSGGSSGSRGSSTGGGVTGWIRDHLPFS